MKTIFLLMRLILYNEIRYWGVWKLNNPSVATSSLSIAECGDLTLT